MKRALIILGLLFGLATGVAQAQARVGVSLSFVDPNFAGQVVIGRPYHRPYYDRPYYYRPYYYRYHRFYHEAPMIIIREPRVVVVRPHRYHARRYHRHW